MSEHSKAVAPSSNRVFVVEPGNIAGVTGYDAWVNTENEALDVSRMIDDSVSGTIRRLGAIWSGDGASDDWDERGDLVEDTIKHALREAVGFERPQIGDVYRTTSGALRWAKAPSRDKSGAGVRQRYDVKCLYHVISVDRYEKAKEENLERCINNLLERIDKDNKQWEMQLFGGQVASVLLPAIAAGRGGLEFHKVARRMVALTKAYFHRNPKSKVTRIGFCARSQSACQVLKNILDRDEDFSEV